MTGVGLKERDDENMKKELKRNCKKYFKEIKKELTCSSNMRLALISELKKEVNYYIDQNVNCTIDNIIDNFGSAIEISSSFETRSDLEKLKKIARKYKLLKIFLPIIALALITIVTFTIILIIYIVRDIGSYDVVVKYSDGALHNLRILS